jgi:hypothetical protein
MGCIVQKAIYVRRCLAVLVHLFIYVYSNSIRPEICQWHYVPKCMNIMKALRNISEGFSFRVHYHIHKSPPLVPLLSPNLIHTAPSYLSKIYCNIILPLAPTLPSGLFPFRFPTTILHVFHVSPMYATRSVNLIFLDFIILTIFVFVESTSNKDSHYAVFSTPTPLLFRSFLIQILFSAPSPSIYVLPFISET